ncbi:MAG: hypothetical protein PHF29_04200 [Candidatus Riflebacteria bacterium]|nr:hypothetical protein [Candidatus Riflebacteria bacterium]
MKYCSKLFLIFVLFGLTLVLGCSSDEPIVSESSGGSGYKIVLASPGTELESGGSLSLIATIKDPDGNLVGNEDEGVIFSSNIGDIEFAETKADIITGVATTVMTWEDTSEDEASEPSKPALITATYRGAFAQIQIMLISEDF